MSQKKIGKNQSRDAKLLVYTPHLNNVGNVKILIRTFGE